MIGRIAIPALASAVIAVTGCDSPRATPTAGIAIGIGVRRAPAPCPEFAGEVSAHDAQGAAWRFAGDRWCRTRKHLGGTRGAGDDAWTPADGNTATHTLTIERDRAALISVPPVLWPTRSAPALAPFVNCRADRRMRAFFTQNWLGRPGDLGCITYRGNGFTLAPLGLPVADGPMPVLLATPDARTATPRGAILFVKGGPYQNLVHGLAARAMTSHLLTRWGSMATIALPAFLGTDRIRAGDGDIARARAELETIVLGLERRGGPLCVVAFSMGAAAVAPLVRRHLDARFLFVAPLAAAPATFVDRARAAGTPAVPIRLDPLRDDGRVVTPPADIATLAYFAGEQNRTLAQRLGNGRLNNLRVVYAKGDMPITPDDAAGLAPVLASNALHLLPPVDHSVEQPYPFTAYRPLVDAFLADCLGSASAEDGTTP